MNVTEPIIQAALLGTASREFASEAFPKSLQTLADSIHEKSKDAEEFLYLTAASAFGYNRAGGEPDRAEGIVPVKTAPKEERPYFSKEQSQLFSKLKDTPYMLIYAYRLTQNSGKIILPEYLQMLIRHAYDRYNPQRLEERRHARRNHQATGTLSSERYPAHYPAAAGRPFLYGRHLLLPARRASHQ